ncbi:MAG: Xaa-Pro peptidase family protein [Desulfobacterota bacterium]|nr:Xaa-Pro peptidase family protein [Thermodesulfobacteriota bacterium]MDW8001826.1 Xaa-Pro peptidase family protein [Deltaproteobacteria bacterium]
MKAQRIEKVKDLLSKYGLDGILLKSPENIFYLSGFRGSEGLLLVTRGDVFLITDFRYITYAKDSVQGLIVLEKGREKDPLPEIVNDYGLKRIGFESNYTSYAIYEEWKKKLKECEILPLKNEIDDIRKIKEPEEIDKIRKAIRIAEEAFIRVYEKIKAGITEKELACELDFEMQRMGAERPSFETIVASGERTAYPHARPSERRIREGDVLIIDFGAQYEGYCSDETCTVFFGEPTKVLKEIRQIVYEAKEKAIEALQAGVPAKKIDSIVRTYIRERGYGDYFGHGTGHGIGLSVHELPQINDLCESILEENMVITIEPGIYIPNVGGVRLEDMVLIREGYPTVLTALRKDLFLV